MLRKMRKAVIIATIFCFTFQPLAAFAAVQWNDGAGADSIVLYRAEGSGANHAYGANSITIGYNATTGEAGTTKGLYATAMGVNTTASGWTSTAMGYNTTASGLISTAMGAGTTASGNYSTAMGADTTALGVVSTAMGWNTTASGNWSTAMGGWTTALGNYSTAMGAGTTASGNYSTAMGADTTALGVVSTAMGWNTTASGNWSTAMGGWTTALGNYSTAMGYNTTASGNYSTAMGSNTTASGSYSTAMGVESTALGLTSIAMGGGVNASGDHAIAMGTGTTASGDWSTAMGSGTNASGVGSTAMGVNTIAFGNYSTAMGHTTTASGQDSTAMGRNTTALGQGSTAMGRNTTALGQGSTAMGYETTASGQLSTAMGYETTASGQLSTAMGSETTASGKGSTAMGRQTTASGIVSTAMGYGTIAAGSGSFAGGGYWNSSTDCASGGKAGGTSSFAFGIGATTGIWTGEGTEESPYEYQSGGDYAIAMGTNATATGDNSIAIGSNANATAINSFAFGGTANGENAVALGTNSTAAANAVALGSNSEAAENTVSVGKVGAERKITNVAAGTISETSTDAVNGSQLYATNQKVDAGWNAQIDGTLVKNVKPGNNKLNFIAGSNISLTDVGGAIKIESLGGADATAVHYDTIANEKITLAGGTGGTTITNIKAGELSATSKDAVNGSQLYATNQAVAANKEAINSIGNAMGNMQQELGSVSHEVKEVGAISAALAGLHFVEPTGEEGDRFAAAAAYGGYRSESAVALGVAYKPDSNVMLSASTSVGHSQNAYNFGVSYKFGEGNTAVTRASLQKQVKAVNEKNAKLEDEVATLRSANAQQNTKIEALEKDLQELKKLLKK